MLKRIKRAYKAFSEPERDGALIIPASSMTKQEASRIADEMGKTLIYSQNDESIRLIDDLEPVGDGDAEFLGEGTQDEFLESEKEKKGLRGIFGL